MYKRHLPLFLVLMLFLCWQCQAQDNSTPSFKSRIIYNSLKSSNIMEKTFDKMINKPKRGGDAVSSKKLNKKLLTEERNVNGFKVLTIWNSSSTNKHIFFLHGGAYVAEANAGHRKLIEDLVLKYGLKVTFIDYPLAPEYQAIFSHEIVAKAYSIIREAYPDDVFYLFGDSAGGGMALAFLQSLRDRNDSGIPAKTVLMSPWLDVSMTNPEIKDQLETDVLLPLEKLKECGALFAGDLDLKNPIVSPIYGDLENLSQIMVFVSNYELFYPDCLLLASKVEAETGSSVDLQVKEEMIHDWVILPIREREETIDEIATFFLEATNTKITGLQVYRD